MFTTLVVANLLLYTGSLVSNYILLHFVCTKSIRLLDLGMSTPLLLRNSILTQIHHSNCIVCVHYVIGWCELMCRGYRVELFISSLILFSLLALCHYATLFASLARWYELECYVFLLFYS